MKPLHLNTSMRYHRNGNGKNENGKKQHNNNNNNHNYNNGNYKSKSNKTSNCKIKKSEDALEHSLNAAVVSASHYENHQELRSNDSSSKKRSKNQKQAVQYHVDKVSGSRGVLLCVLLNCLQSDISSSNRLTAPSGKYTLAAKRYTEGSCHSVKDRTKHPKLVGADIYVARLVNCSTSPRGTDYSGATPKVSVDMSASSSGLDNICGGVCEGSLHDELIYKELHETDSDGLPKTEQSILGGIAESRPCYRCVSYMHSVGIKRVFWTTYAGQWEGAKVRDLMDSLAGRPAASGDESSSLGGHVFVTKHEVLMMRRMSDGSRDSKR